ncbi:MAG TPA: SUF system NifU family Fe-S cluster assembly protein [Actinomycetota bacterium]|nr:SUF system NifU family Fe-S cluster assembly protein [Actinomycetota bacterium]
MSSLDELYKEVILDHYRAPRNRGHIDEAEVHLHRDNPLCGDEIDLYVDIQDGKVVRVAFDGKGCSISQASVSMMTEKLKGLSVAEAEGLANMFKQMMQGENPQNPDSLGDLIALQGVQKYPVRIKCALLGWNTFLDGLRVYNEKHTGA